MTQGNRFFFSDTAGLMHIGTHRDCDSMRVICTSSRHAKHKHREWKIGTKSHPKQEAIYN